VSTAEPISPLGQTADEVASENYARSERYRAQHDHLAPYRVVARAVILARGAHGLTQRELGRAIGTTDTAISRIESGRHAVNVETLAKLGKVLDLSFMVGSAAIADAVGADPRCVVVPEIAIEPAAPPTGRSVQSATAARPASRPPYSPAPTYAFGDTVGSAPDTLKAR